jgi:zinc protease
LAFLPLSGAAPDLRSAAAQEKPISTSCQRHDGHHQARPRAPTAVHMLYVRVGSMDEVDGSTGVAHMLEHMLFKGTPTCKPGEFSRRWPRSAAARTPSPRATTPATYQQIPANRLEEVMKLESDRFATTSGRTRSSSGSWEVVKEERRMRTEDNPRSQLYEQLSAVTYQASPYRRPVVGWMSDLDAMTPKRRARVLQSHWYVPANAAVIIAGDVDVPKVRQLVDKYYGRIRPAGAAAQAARGTRAGRHPPHGVQGARRPALRGARLQGAAAHVVRKGPPTTMTRWRSPCWPPCSTATRAPASIAP